MERINVKNSRGLNLVGDLYSDDNKSIIIMSHGFTGDRHEWGTFDKIAENFHKANFDVLTFDFSGSGESDDDSLTVGKQIDDLNSIIDFVKQKKYENIILLGLSLGGLISLNCYNPDIKAIIGMAPVTDKIDYEWKDRYSDEQMVELKDKGYITKVRDEGFRKIIIIDEQMLRDRENVVQEKLLENINCPVLIFHGDKDDRVPLDNSKKAIEILGANSKLDIIKGEGHHFRNSIDYVVNKTVDWLKNLNL